MEPEKWAVELVKIPQQVQKRPARSGALRLTMAWQLAVAETDEEAREAYEPHRKHAERPPGRQAQTFVVHRGVGESDAFDSDPEAQSFCQPLDCIALAQQPEIRGWQ